MNRHFLLKQLHSNLKNNDTVDENNMVSNLSINNINLQTKIYIIGGVSSGGSYKFINDFRKFYTNSLQIKSNDILQSIKFNCNDILLIQHLVDDITPRDLLKLKKKYNCNLIINIHDFYYLAGIDGCANGYLLNNINISIDILHLFNEAKYIIHPSTFTYDEYRKYFSSRNFIMIPHIDYEELDSKLNIPSINNIINIGVLHEFNEYKGKELIEYLMHKYPYYGEYKIEFKIIGININKYNENEFFEYLLKYKIHCLTLLNKFGETYCYSLSKFLKSGLPIIYNNIGAFKERIPTKEYFFKVFDNEKDINLNSILENKFIELLDYIISYTSAIPYKYTNFSNINLKLIVPDGYKNILKNTNQIKSYCIYFPQFHAIKENNFNYYDGYTDITNLDLLVKEKNENGITEDHYTPSTAILPIDNNIEYDLVNNKQLIQKQIDLLVEYNISGFAIYYYWFSKNSITNQNMIMEKVINKFFSNEIEMKGRKVFLVWANESWSKNAAFNNETEIIENIYNEEEFIKNIENLMTYFKHNNYLKINNKPVFLIHHPWFIHDEELNLFEKLINEKCILNNFDGCHLIVNSMIKHRENFKNYDFHFNYKNNNHIKIIDNQVSIDYKVYIDDLEKRIYNLEPCIKTLVFNFNNKPRFYKPNKIKNSTMTINNNEEEYLRYINMIYQSYNDSEQEIDKILLINSWNEWGESMAIEPSNEKGTYYLDLLKNII